MFMHPLQPLLKIVTDMRLCIEARNYPGSSLNCARMMPAVSILWATDPPRCPDSRARWDTYSAPVLAQLREAAAALHGWLYATGRRGVQIKTQWMHECIVQAQDVLRLPGLDDLYTAVPAIVPDKPGPAVRSADAG